MRFPYLFITELVQINNSDPFVHLSIVSTCISFGQALTDFCCFSISISKKNAGWFPNSSHIPSVDKDQPATPGVDFKVVNNLHFSTWSILVQIIICFGVIHQKKNNMVYRKVLSKKSGMTQFCGDCVFFVSPNKMKCSHAY